MQISNLWKARFIVGLIMLGLAFLGMVITDIRETGGWDYWKWAVPIYAILALWLSWYVKSTNETFSLNDLWRELALWGGLFISIFFVSYLVNIGTISRFVAGIFHLILLSLAVFIAGIYIERIFIVIGFVLGIFAVLTALLVQYLYSIILPIVIGAGLIIFISIWMSHRKSKMLR